VTWLSFKPLGLPALPGKQKRGCTLRCIPF
jgi:hypothetical protein